MAKKTKKAKGKMLPVHTIDIAVVDDHGGMTMLVGLKDGSVVPFTADMVSGIVEVANRHMLAAADIQGRN